MKISKLSTRIAIACGLSAMSLVAAQIVLPAGLSGSKAYAAIDVCDWYDVDWGEMSADAQRAWAALGWDEARWEGIYPYPPASDEKFWAELTPDEKSAAEHLGYAWRTWDVDTCSLSTSGAYQYDPDAK